MGQKTHRFEGKCQGWSFHAEGRGPRKAEISEHLGTAGDWMHTAGLSLNGASKAKAVFKKSDSCPKHPPVASFLTRVEG